MITTGARVAAVVIVTACESKAPSQVANDVVAAPVEAAPAEPIATVAPPLPPSCERCTDAACAPPDAHACAVVADDYKRGKGVPFDLKKHGDFAERACIHGDGRCSMPAAASVRPRTASRWAGWRRAVAADPPIPRWRRSHGRKAADAGDLDGCDEIIKLGLAPDVIESRRAKVFAHACANGVTTACAPAE